MSGKKIKVSEIRKLVEDIKEAEKCPICKGPRIPVICSEHGGAFMALYCKKDGIILTHKKTGKTKQLFKELATPKKGKK